MYKYEVSAVVVTYNPIFEKLMATLQSLLEQENIRFEIIVSDDSSTNNYFQEIESFFRKNKFNDYSLVRHQENVGTVANFYDALKHASGKYNYVISPGDFIYDNSTLEALYSYAEKTKSKVVFGKPIGYRNILGNAQIDSSFLKPRRPIAFSRNVPMFLKKRAFFFGNNILGAGMFRETESTIMYLNTVKNFSRYVEDNTMNALMLLDGENITFINRNIVWYELETGLSTGGHDWNPKIKADFDNLYNYIGLKYSSDKMVREVISVWNTQFNSDSLYAKIRKLNIFDILLKLLPKMRVKVQMADIRNLNRILNNEVTI